MAMAVAPDSGGTPCILDKFSDDVVRIEVPEQIPEDLPEDAFSRFTALEALVLKGCGLKRIPSSLFTLKTLKSLDISENKLEYIPPEIGMLENLEELFISGNPATNMSPLSQLQYLHKNLIHFMQALTKDVTKIEKRYWSHWHKNEMLSFTIMSYNILAPHCEKNRERFPFSSLRFLDRSYRIPKIKQIITELDSDICCLQEVEGGFFRDDLEPFMAERGFTGHHCPKSRAAGMFAQERRDLVMGEATFVRNTRFSIIDTKIVDYRTHRLCNAISNKEELSKHDETAMLTFIKSRYVPGIDIVVVNVHLYWERLEARVRESQLYIAVEAAMDFGYEHSKEFDVIIAGDFNSTYNTLPLNSLAKRPEGFVSAYEALGIQPRFTMYAPGYVVPIDHIYSTCWGIHPASVLLPNDEQHILQNYIGFPAEHYPSDHIHLAAAYWVKIPRSYPPPRDPVLVEEVETPKFVIVKPEKKKSSVSLKIVKRSHE